MLNVARDSMAHIGFSPATRVFEAAGAAACLITDAWEGIEQFLTPDAEVLVARDGQDVADHVAALTPDRARAIGQAALRRVLAEHTYAHRGEQVDALFRSATGREPAPAPHTVRAEPVEAVPFFSGAGEKEGKPFDRLRANGGGLAAPSKAGAAA